MAIHSTMDGLRGYWCLVAKSCSSWPHGLKQARLPCPLLSPGICSDSRPLSRWCHPTISPSVAPFSACPQSFPASGSFPVSQLFISGGQSIGASASVLPMNIQGQFPLELNGLISLLSKGLSRVFSTTSLKASVFQCSDFLVIQLSRGCGLFLFLLLQVSYYKRKLHKAWALSGFLTWQHLIITISSFLKYSS